MYCEGKFNLVTGNLFYPGLLLFSRNVSDRAHIATHPQFELSEYIRHNQIIKSCLFAASI